MGDLAALTDTLAVLVADALEDWPVVAGAPLRSPVTEGAAVNVPTLAWPTDDPAMFTATWTVRLYWPPSDAAYGTLLDAVETVTGAVNLSNVPWTVTQATPTLSAVAAGDVPAYELTVSAPLRLTL